MMSATVEFFIFVKVNEVDKEFFTHRTVETAGMPGPMRSSSRGCHTDVAGINHTGTLKWKKKLNDWILELYIVIWRKKSRSHFWNGDFLEIPPLFHEFFKRLDKKKTVTQMSLASITPVHCKQKSKVGWWVIFFFLFFYLHRTSGDVGTWCIW